MVLTNKSIVTVLIAIAFMIVMFMSTASAYATSTTAKAYIKGCKRNDTVSFFVDKPEGGSLIETTSDNSTYKRGSLTTNVVIPEGYSETDVLIMECSKGSLATTIAEATNFCGGEDGLGIYQHLASQSVKFCFKVTS